MSPGALRVGVAADAKGSASMGRRGQGTMMCSHPTPARHIVMGRGGFSDSQLGSRPARVSRQQRSGSRMCDRAAHPRQICPMPLGLLGGRARSEPKQLARDKVFSGGGGGWATPAISLGLWLRRGIGQARVWRVGWSPVTGLTRGRGLEERARQAGRQAGRPAGPTAHRGSRQLLHKRGGPTAEVAARSDQQGPDPCSASANFHCDGSGSWQLADETARQLPASHHSRVSSSAAAAAAAAAAALSHLVLLRPSSVDSARGTRSRPLPVARRPA
ncbi:hypothetical protein B0J12DRAFT_767041, partial [Macrophomina phaseolina]